MQFLVSNKIVNLIVSLFKVIGDHCLPGPLGKRCRDEKAAHATQNHGQQDMSHNAAGGIDSESSKVDSNDGSTDGSRSSSSSYDINGSSSDGSGSASSSQSSESTHYITSNKSRILVLTLACVAGSAALAATIFGATRRGSRARNHPLYGVLNQRLQLLQKLNHASSSTKTTRGPRIILEDEHVPATQYQLA